MARLPSTRWTQPPLMSRAAAAWVVAVFAFDYLFSQIKVRSRPPRTCAFSLRHTTSHRINTMPPAFLHGPCFCFCLAHVHVHVTCTCCTCACTCCTCHVVHVTCTCCCCHVVVVVVVVHVVVHVAVDVDVVGVVVVVGTRVVPTAADARCFQKKSFARKKRKR